MQVPRGRVSFSFLISALDWGEWSASRLAALYPPEKGPPRYPLGRRLGGPQDMVWTQRLEEKSFASAGDRTPFVSL
jgi:hypothetical protein